MNSSHSSYTLQGSILNHLESPAHRLLSRLEQKHNAPLQALQPLGKKPGQRKVRGYTCQECVTLDIHVIQRARRAEP